jgi:hypothetical protein
VLWFEGCWKNALTVTVAPKEKQLELHIWKEIGKLWPRFKKHFPTAELTHLKIQMSPDPEYEGWAAHGFVAGVSAAESSTSATKAQGFHAEHMLIIFEETPGISPAIMMAFRQTCRAPHNIRLGFGNPDNVHDELHKLGTSPGARLIRASALDHPNVVKRDASIIPGAASYEAIEEEKLADDAGEEAVLYKSRIRGISPEQAKNAMFRREWLDRAFDRWKDIEARKKLAVGGVALGVDVANSEDGDPAAVSRWKGATLPKIEQFPCPDANDLGTIIAIEAVEQNIPGINIGVDSVGVGAGCINEVRRAKGYENVQALYSSVPAYKGDMKGDTGQSYEWVPDANRFYNLRAQMYWTFREDLRMNRLAIKRNASLFREMTSIEYRLFNGQVRVLEKAEIIKLVGNSPNETDAVVYGNFVRTRSVENEPELPKTAEYGRDPRGDYATIVPIEEQYAGISSNTHDFEQLGSGF